MKTYYDKDTNKDLIKNKKVAIFGYSLDQAVFKLKFFDIHGDDV